MNWRCRLVSIQLKLSTIIPYSILLTANLFFCCARPSQEGNRVDIIVLRVYDPFVHGQVIRPFYSNKVNTRFFDLPILPVLAHRQLKPTAKFSLSLFSPFFVSRKNLFSFFPPCLPYHPTHYYTYTTTPRHASRRVSLSFQTTHHQSYHTFSLSTFLLLSFLPTGTKTKTKSQTKENNALRTIKQERIVPLLCPLEAKRI